MDNQPIQPPVLQTSQPINNQYQAPVDAPKRSPRPLLYSLAVVLLLAGSSFAVYAWQHSKVTSSNTKISNLQSELSSLRSQINKLSKQATTEPSSTANTSSNPYSGWKSYTLKYEKLTFKYPAAWTVDDISGSQGPTPNTDSLTLTASDSFNISIDDGWDGGGDPLMLDTNNPEPIKFISNPSYLVFVHPRIIGPSSVDPNSVVSAILMTNPSTQYGQNNTTGYFPQDKNAHGDPNINNGGSTLLVSGGYSGSNAKTFSTVNQAENDPEFKNFVLTIQSMHY